VKGSAEKEPLPADKSPFVQVFQYGAYHEGYWRYDHMVLQMEDCIDVLKVLYPEFYVVFLFDHSCGHDRMRLDGLQPNDVGVKFGGKQPKMRSTKIEREDGYLGPFGRKVNVGDV
jgi:hypothetical protein